MPPTVAPPSAARLSSLLSSTLPLLLERARSLSLALDPSPFTEQTALKNLQLLAQGIAALELEARSGLRVGDGGQVTGGQKPASADERRRLREGLERCLGMMEVDDSGRAKVAGIREALVRSRPTSPVPSPPAAGPTPVVSVRSNPFLEDSDDDEDTDSRLDPLAPSTTKSTGQGRYRDSPSPARLSPDMREDLDEPYRDEGSMLLEQRGMMDDQDHRLTHLSSSIARQHDLSLQIGDELATHHDLLEDVDAHVDRTSASLARARRKLDGFARNARDHASVATIVALIVLLAILILVLKT